LTEALIAMPRSKSVILFETYCDIYYRIPVSHFIAYPNMRLIGITKRRVRKL